MNTGLVAWTILAANAAEVLTTLAFLTGVGLVLGLALGGLFYWGLAKAKAFGFGWKWAGCLRALAATWIILAVGLLGGLAGLLEGGLRSVEIIVMKSQFRTEVLDPIGHVGAYGVQWLDGFLASPPGADAPAEKAEAAGDVRAEALEQGEAELDVPRFLERLENADSAVVGAAIKHAEVALRKRFCIPPGGIVETLFVALLRDLASHELRKAVKEPMREYGLSYGVRKFLDSLPAAAQKSGAPDTITYAELSDHVVEYLAVPLIIAPARSFVRTKQALTALCIPLALAPPLLLFWLLRVLERRRAKSKTRTAAAATVPEALPVTEPAGPAPPPNPPAGAAGG